MRILLFILALLSAPFAEAKDITFYCKKALHKQGDHSISKIDYIYVINLEKDLARFRKLKKEFKKYDITPYRFNAVKPKELNYRNLSRICFRTKKEGNVYQALRLMKYGKNFSLIPSSMNYENTNFVHYSMCLEDLARDLDFLSIIFDAYKNKYEAIWIMEDYVNIILDPNVLSGDIVYLEQFDHNWDVLYTDYESKAHRPVRFDDFYLPLRTDVNFLTSDYYRGREISSPPFASLGLRSGAYSFILSRHGIKKIVDYYKSHKFFIPFEIELQIIPDMNRYVLLEDVVTN